MKIIKNIFHFLGSFYFAILIITMMAIIVTLGTFLESTTESHAYAALFTYSNPVFNGILVALFINILVSALRRWPFKKKHFPFLITHLGLLMLISGVAIKNIWGVQGNMSLAEGGVSNTLSIPHTQVVHIEKRAPNKVTEILSEEVPLASNVFMRKRRVERSAEKTFPSLSLELVEYCPHCEEKWDSWIKGDMGHIAGLEPFPVYKLKESDTSIPISTKVKLYRDVDEVWDIYAVEADDSKKALDLIIGDTQITDGDLYTPREQHEVVTQPKIIFIKSDDENILVQAVDRYGHVYSKEYNSTEISPLVVYDEGFAGYFATITIPFPAFPYDELTVKQAKIHETVKLLRQQRIESTTISPPLQLLCRACEVTGCDFSYSLAQIYEGNLAADVTHTLEQLEWSFMPIEATKICYWTAVIQNHLKSPSSENIPEFIKNLEVKDSLLREVQRIAGRLPDLSSSTARFSEGIALAMYQASLELYGIDLNFLCPSLSKDDTERCLLNFLQDNITESNLTEAFPPLKTLPFQQKVSVLEKLSKNHDVIGQIIPEGNIIDILPTFSRPDLWDGLSRKMSHHEITFETPVSPIYTPLPPTTKLEENRPKVTLFAKEGDNRQFISLAYDPTGQRMKWPILKGQYRINFQPQSIQLPLSIRLHDARQINYPDSNQPLSYEADIIPSANGGEYVTISMNNVFESNEGYRFYLSNITPGDESSVQHVLLVVNYDPAKYLLTYPGGILIALGTLLLFWFKLNFVPGK